MFTGNQKIENIIKSWYFATFGFHDSSERFWRNKQISVYKEGLCSRDWI